MKTILILILIFNVSLVQAGYFEHATVAVACEEGKTAEEAKKALNEYLNRNHPDKNKSFKTTTMGLKGVIKNWEIVRIQILENIPEKGKVCMEYEIKKNYAYPPLCKNFEHRIGTNLSKSIEDSINLVLFVKQMDFYDFMKIQMQLNCISSECQNVETPPPTALKFKNDLLIEKLGFMTGSYKSTIACAIIKIKTPK